MKVLTLLSCLFLWVSCGKQQAFTPDSYNQVYLSFGHGGGITGAVTQFYILEDGRAYKRINKDSLSYIGKLNPKLTDQQFERYNQ